MPDSITVRIEGLKEFEALLKRIGDRAPRALAAAANDTAKHVRAEASRDIRSEFNLKASTLKRAITIRQASTARPLAEVIATGRPIPVAEFGARPVITRRKPLRRGVSVAIKRGEKRRVLKHAFLARMKSGHLGAFVRAGLDRLPIIERKVFTVPTMWKQHIEKHVAEAAPFLRRRLLAQLERLLKGK